MSQVPFPRLADRPLAGSPPGQAGGPTDAQLMAALVAKDANALSALYDRHAGLVMSIGLRVLNDRQAAEELVVDVFMEMWRRAERFDPSRGSAVVYMATLSRSRAIDRRRSQRTQVQAVSLDSVAGQSEQDGAPTPVEAASDSEQRKLIRQALGSLDQHHREVLEMAYFQGLSHNDIAAKTGRPLGTIKTHIRQALIRLKGFTRSLDLRG